ncbi:hypothetical protein [Culturomica massiliensis]|jgi:hypothetical protein|uniref:hypothetical protein n=1 Tax=Culturomica massiliensis TaxID=1841857 RepID=UPI000E55C8BA|nr:MULTISPECIES: hypothetical protein [Odoribacteraceae]RHV89217.1 hypothetical protein DXA95_16120 [Odoribacter sp. OF09-27XD]
MEAISKLINQVNTLIDKTTLNNQEKKQLRADITQTIYRNLDAVTQEQSDAWHTSPGPNWLRHLYRLIVLTTEYFKNRKKSKQ